MSEETTRRRPCNPTEIALKSFFLGPQSENAPWLLSSLQSLVEGWIDWRKHCFPQDGMAIGASDQLQAEFQERQQRTRALLDQLSRRFEGELPKFSPRYVGHMFSELSMPALLGHILTLLHNPNIIAREAATVAADIETEAMDDLARMVGMRPGYGHFTSGGTVANYESVVRANARIHAWMALGAVARRRGVASPGLFEAAHLGWSQFAAWRQGVTQEELAPMLPELAGAWQAGQAIAAAYQVDYRPPLLLVPGSAHYSWRKAARILGIGEAQFVAVQADEHGRYCVADLRARIELCRQQQQPILAVVSVAGTTETGAIDPVDRIADLLEEFRVEQGLHIWHHVDAAYGGFFCSMLREPERGPAWTEPGPLSVEAMVALGAISRADSVTLDPHKLGYVPYSSGAFLCRDEQDYTCVKILAPYLAYAGEGEEEPTPLQSRDRGPYTLEGSRSAAGAVATWLTARAIGLDQAGYGLLLARTVRQKQRLQDWLVEHVSSARLVPAADSNLLCFCLADQGEPLSQTNERTLRILTRLDSESRYFLTKTAFPLQGADAAMGRRFVDGWQAQVDTDQVLVLRLCLMNPFFDSSELDVEHVRALVVALCEVAGVEPGPR
jgi:glutamate/tyrosine decarboxylase-like PLP-dependent enzyme